VVWLHQGLTQKKKNQAIANYQDSSALDPDTTIPRYLIAQTSTFSVGLTFQEVFGICLIEPDFRLDAMLQVFARHCRQGNINPITHSWMLLASSNATEEKIMEINQLKGSINKAMVRKKHELLDKAGEDNDAGSDIEILDVM